MKADFVKLNILLSSGLFITGAKVRDSSIVILSATDFASNIRFGFDVEKKVSMDKRIKMTEKDITEIINGLTPKK